MRLSAKLCIYLQLNGNLQKIDFPSANFYLIYSFCNKYKILLKWNKYIQIHEKEKIPNYYTIFKWHICTYKMQLFWHYKVLRYNTEFTILYTCICIVRVIFYFQKSQAPDVIYFLIIKNIYFLPKNTLLGRVYIFLLFITQGVLCQKLKSKAWINGANI